MSLENAITANTAAIEALTAVLRGGIVTPGAATGAATGATEPKAPKTPKAGKSEAKFTASQMQALLSKVKESKGVSEAKSIIELKGGAKKMADIIDPVKIDAVCQACEEALKEDESGADDDM